MAFGHTLFYEDVPCELASTLFARDSSTLTQEELKVLEDFMFHRSGAFPLIGEFAAYVKMSPNVWKAAFWPNTLPKTSRAKSSAATPFKLSISKRS